MKPIDILTSTLRIAELAGQLANETAIAVDLEADSLHNYQEKICLIQISTPQQTFLIDTLAAVDLAPLKTVFANPAIRKIFHAADYDLRSLKRDFDLHVSGLFDTMVCAQLLGEERIGLADLLKKYFGVELDKKYQKADWSRRPLSGEMIRYAAADTNYLHPLTEMFTTRLLKLGRMDWVAEECALLEEVRFAESSGPLCVRFKGAATLSRRELGVLENLLRWREEEGARLNRPVYKILGNQPLLELARRMPQEKAALAGIEGLPPRLVEKFGTPLLAAIARGRQLPETALPLLPRQSRKPRDPAREDRFKALKTWREEIAAAYALAPGVLINNFTLEAVALANPQSIADLDHIDGLKKWQKSELGSGLVGALARRGPG